MTNSISNQKAKMEATKTPKWIRHPSGAHVINIGCVQVEVYRQGRDRRWFVRVLGAHYLDPCEPTAAKAKRAAIAEIRAVLIEALAELDAYEKEITSR